MDSDIPTPFCLDPCRSEFATRVWPPMFAASPSLMSGQVLVRRGYKLSVNYGLASLGRDIMNELKATPDRVLSEWTRAASRLLGLKWETADTITLSAVMSENGATVRFPAITRSTFREYENAGFYDIQPTIAADIHVAAVAHFTASDMRTAELQFDAAFIRVCDETPMIVSVGRC